MLLMYHTDIQYVYVMRMLVVHHLKYLVIYKRSHSQSDAGLAANVMFTL